MGIDSMFHRIVPRAIGNFLTTLKTGIRLEWLAPSQVTPSDMTCIDVMVEVSFAFEWIKLFLSMASCYLSFDWFWKPIKCTRIPIVNWIMRVVACRCFSLLPLQFNVVNHKVSVVCVLCMGKELCEKAKSRKTEAKAMNREHSFDDDDMQLARQGYERFFNGDVNDVAIVSVQRQQEITTFVEKTPNRNQIKLSLSQEQIVKRMSGDGVVSNGVKRSQSANIQKTFITPTPNDRNHWYGGHSFDTQSLVLRRPSLIPVKVNSSRIHMSLMIKRSMQMQKSGMLSTAAGGMRKMSMPNAVLGTDDHTQAMTSLPYIPTTDAGPSAKAIPLDKKFICGFCRNTLNDPRVLDCLHTFCFDCLPDLEQPTMKSNVAKVNVVLAPGSRENSELEMSCSSRMYFNSRCSKLVVDLVEYSVFNFSKKRRIEYRDGQRF